MAFANVNIGAYPADGNGDPIRTAFSKINQNFANIAAGQVTVNAPVLSVAGRTGNVRLVVGDVIGAASNAFVTNTVVTANTAMKAYVDDHINVSPGYGNVNVESYLPTSTTIINIQSDVHDLSANVGSYEFYANGQMSSFNGLFVDIINDQSAANTHIQTLDANLGVVTSQTIPGLISGISATNANIQTLDANVGVITSQTIPGLNSSILAANSAIITANTEMKAYVDSYISGGNNFASNVVLTSNTATNDNATGALVITDAGGAAIGGNVNLNGQLFVGPGAQTPFLNQAIAVKRGSSLSGPGAQFTQDAIINTSPNGSSDFIAYPDNYPGFNSDHGWMDMGITGSLFDDPLFEITKANDGYIFMSAAHPTPVPLGGNLVLATDWTGSHNDIMFGVGGFFSNAEVARFHGNTSNNGWFNVKVDTFMHANLAVSGNIIGNVIAYELRGNIETPFQDKITTVGPLTNLEVIGNVVLHDGITSLSGVITTDTLYISGNTTFNNNTTTISSEEINSNVRHIVLRHNAVNQADASGVGIMTPYSRFVYNAVFDSWGSNVNITPTDASTSNIGHLGWNWQNGFFDNIYGEVLTAQQPRISRVGNLSGLNSPTGDATLTSNLSVTGNLTVGDIAYIMGNYQNWQGNVYTISSALDQIAARLTAGNI